MSITLNIVADNSEHLFAEMYQIMRGAFGAGGPFAEVKEVTPPVPVTKADSPFVPAAAESAGSPSAETSTSPSAATASPSDTAAAPEKKPRAARGTRKTSRADVPAGEPESAETQAQDAADEAAETEAATAERVAETGKKLTLDDVRNAAGEYVAMYGPAHANTDGQQVLKMLFGDTVKNEKGNYAMSKIPDDQESLGKVVEGFKEMLEKNPFKRTPVAGQAGA